MAAQEDHKHLAVAPPEEYDYESLPPNFSLAANMAAGAFAGIAEHSVMYPIDLLKVCFLSCLVVAEWVDDGVDDGGRGIMCVCHVLWRIWLTG